MHPLISAGLAGVCLLIGAATTAAPLRSGSFDDQAREVPISLPAIAEEAQGLFQRIDQDGSGILDRDEFASHYLVMSELIRLRGEVDLPLVVPMSVALPQGPLPPLSIAERGAIDLSAREVFSIFAEDDAMRPQEFAAYRISVYRSADSNLDGTLSEGELRQLGLRLAGEAALGS